MDEKTNEMYQEYLDEKLDLIFNGEDGIEHPNTLRESYNEHKYPKGPELIVKEGEYGKIEGYNYVDEKGKEIFPRDFKDAHEFHEGMAVVGKQSDIGYEVRYNYMKPNGEYLFRMWCSYTGDFSEGYAPVSDLFKRNFIDHEGKFLFEESLTLDYLGEFHEGYALVRLRGLYNFIDKNGKYLFDEWLDHRIVGHLSCGRILCGESYFIDITGRRVSKSYYDARDYHEGYAAVYTEGKWHFIDVNDNPINSELYDDVTDFHGGYAFVKKDKKWNVIDTSGKLVDNWSTRKPKTRIISSNFTYINNRLLCHTENMDGYTIKRGILGYTCTSKMDSFRMPFRPLKKYGSRYVLCLNKDILMMFDMAANKYIELGSIKDVEFDDNFIIDHANKLVYLIYQNQMIDITKYYEEKLKDKKTITITSSIVKIISKNDFFIKNEDDIKECIIDERKKNKEIINQQKEQAELQRIKESKEQAERDDKENQEKARGMREKIREQLQQLEELEAKTGKHERWPVSNLFITVGDHQEIKPEYLIPGMLRHVDLKGVSFKNVKISGIDFRGCNIPLNPQEVYGKDLSGCNFEGLYIEPFMDFTGVDIRGARFSDDNDSRTVDWVNATFSQAVYDENTTYNGNSFVELYGECKKRRK